MYHRFLYICIACLSLALLTGSVWAQPNNPQCREQLRLLLAEYGKIASSDALTIHYHQWQEQAGVPGPRTEHRLWTKGNRMRYENADYGFVQDGQHQIVIDHSSETIMIQDQAPQDATQGAEIRAFMNLSSAKQADSLAAIATAIVCEGFGRIRIDLPEKLKGQPQSIKRIVWEFDPLAKRMIRQDITYYASAEGPGELHDIYLYEELSLAVEDHDLPISGLVILYPDKALSPRFADYRVIDLRAKK
jgi:hypothetical protein